MKQKKEGLVNNKVTIIGLGEIGSDTLKETNKKRKDVFGVDINPKILSKLSSEGYNVGNEIPISDVYIIAVYLTEQVMEVIKKINCTNNPLIVIESTVEPGTYKTIQEWKKKNNYRFDIVLFPHNLIHVTTPEIAELSKPMENAYRFLEIAIAEEIKMLCEEKGIDFNKLRKAMNTKWNINVKEAKNGINGKCLPKDTDIINNFFDENKIIKNAIEIDKRYKEYVKKKKNVSGE